MMVSPPVVSINETSMYWNQQGDAVYNVYAINSLTNVASVILSATSFTSLSYLPVDIARSYYVTAVSVGSDSIESLPSNIVAITTSASKPYNFKVSGSALSWNNTDSFVTYKIKNQNGTILGTTTNKSIDVSNIPIESSTGICTLYVESYDGPTMIAVSNAYVFNAYASGNFTLSGTVLSWSVTTIPDNDVIYKIYRNSVFLSDACGSSFDIAIYTEDITLHIFEIFSVDPTSGAYYTSSLSSYLPPSYIPSAPFNISLSGNILSWDNIDSFASYTITDENGRSFGKTSDKWFDVSSILVNKSKQILYINTDYDSIFLASSNAFVYDPYKPVSLSFGLACAAASPNATSSVFGSGFAADISLGSTCIPV
jgi:hypothetical protein